MWRQSAGWPTPWNFGLQWTWKEKVSEARRRPSLRSVCKQISSKMEGTCLGVVCNSTSTWNRCFFHRATTWISYCFCPSFSTFPPPRLFRACSGAGSRRPVDVLRNSDIQGRWKVQSYGLCVSVTLSSSWERRRLRMHTCYCAFDASLRWFQTHITSWCERGMIDSFVSVMYGPTTYFRWWGIRLKFIIIFV